MVGNDDYATTSRHIAKVQDDFSFSVCSLRKRKKEKGQSKGGMGGRHAATTQGFKGEGCDALAVAHPYALELSRPPPVHHADGMRVWATQQPGGCGPGPSATFPTADFYRRGTTFNWGNFSSYDDSAKAYLPQHSIPVLDLSPLYYRPEAHTQVFEHGFRALDCLHFCMPGPLDLFGVLVQRMLEEGAQTSAEMP